VRRSRLAEVAVRDARALSHDPTVPVDFTDFSDDTAGMGLLMTTKNDLNMFAFLNQLSIL